MVKLRVRFEPIDINVDDIEDFERVFKAVRNSINSMHKSIHDEVIPSIRKVYRVDDNGFPLEE